VAVLIVPPLDEEPWPTLGPQIEAFLNERAVFGPGSLKGEPARLDPEKRAALYRAYEVYPRGHPMAGRRRFQRVAFSFRKGVGKTEFGAWIAYAELHPDAPVRCDGFDANGQPVGRPVVDPYLPMVGFSEDQTEELAFGALAVICQEGPDGALFDIGLQRVIRLGPRGQADGRAVALAAAPNSRDGARTTWQLADETHRLYLPRLVHGWETMLANLPKRPYEDPWAMELTTAGQLGQDSIAEMTHREAEAIERGENNDSDLFYFHRYAGPGHDLTTIEGRIKAIAEATGPAGEYGPGQFRTIARQWDRPGADRGYLARVWLNQWVRGDAQAFDLARWRNNAREGVIPDGELVVAGFDGARFRDSTALVVTDVDTGTQQLVAIWERPADLIESVEWEVPEAEVDTAVEMIFDKWQCWALWGDPPHWVEAMGRWAATRPDQVKEWWSNRLKPMANAIAQYNEAIAADQVGPAAASPLARTFDRHMGSAGRRSVNLWDDAGRQLFILRKIHPERKIDASMAAVISWQARLEALRKGAKKKPKTSGVPRRIR
jgi:hypothetical protein